MTMLSPPTASSRTDVARCLDRDPDTGSPAAQAARRERVQALHRAYWFDRFDEAGEYVKGAEPGGGDFRQRMWHAMSLLNGEERHKERARSLLGHLLPLKVGHFWASGVASILVRWGDELGDELREALREKLAEALPREMTQSFRGYNDNYPAMAALSAIVGGELCGDAAAVAGGIANLHTMRRLLTRRGCLTEYASPTYSAITLTCLAEIVELTQNQEARELALAGEQRVWVELASRFHPATSFIAGPHSRAYMVDMVAHTHNAHVTLYQALGEAVFVNPVRCMFASELSEPGRPGPGSDSAPAPGIQGQALHGGQGLGMGHGAWQTMPTYHPSPEAVELALHKRLPMTVEADMEQAAFPRNVWEATTHPDTPYAEFPAGPAHLTTHLTQDYALGTSSNVCLDGYQHTGVHLVYRRRRPTADAPARLQDVATLFARYLQRDREPNRHKHLGDEGRTICLQHASTAMVAYWPKLGWGSKPSLPDATAKATDTLKLSLLIPHFWGGEGGQEVWLGEQHIDGWHGQSIEPTSIYIKDGPVFLAIHPLALHDHGRDVAVRLREVNGFGMIDLINYAGPERTFTAPDLLTTRNGFILEVASQTDDNDFQTFRHTHPTPTLSESGGGASEASGTARAKPTLTDRYDRPDGMRTIRYARPDLTLEMAFAPISEGIKYREINGRLVRPPKLTIPGFDTASLPWHGV